MVPGGAYAAGTASWSSLTSIWQRFPKHDSTHEATACKMQRSLSYFDLNVLCCQKDMEKRV